MILKISCFLLFGIQSFINGIPYNIKSSFYNNDRLENVLQNLPNRLSKYGLQFHHQHAKESHPDTVHRSYEPDNNREQDPKSLSNVQIFNNLIGMKNIARSGGRDEDETYETDLVENLRMCKKEPRVYNCTKKSCNNKKHARTGYGKENIDELLQLLNDLDKKIDDDSKHKKQSYDDKCLGRSSYGKENIDELLQLLNDLDKKIEDSKHNLDLKGTDKIKGDRGDNRDAWNSGRHHFKNNILRCSRGNCGRTTDAKDENYNRYDVCTCTRDSKNADDMRCKCSDAKNDVIDKY